MRLLRLLVLIAIVAIVARLAVRSVSVESSGDKVQITIDKQQLRAARHDLEETGRRAAGKVGAALEHAGESLKVDAHESRGGD